MKKHFFLILGFLVILNLSCSRNNNKNSNNYKKENLNIQKIDIEQLIYDLKSADQKLTPKEVVLRNGEKVYQYFKLNSKKDLTEKEIKERINLGSSFYIRERARIKILLNKINSLNINNRLEYINSGAMGLWIPSQKLVLLNTELIKSGSYIFLNVLNHEIIHIAQSCFSNSLTSIPKRIGLPLDFNKSIQTNLDHKLYSKNTEEGLLIEREAYTYSDKDEAAEKLLDRFCFK